MLILGVLWVESEQKSAVQISALFEIQLLTLGRYFSHTSNQCGYGWVGVR